MLGQSVHALRVTVLQCALPHEYTVRSPVSEELYVALFNAIMTAGDIQRYKGRKGRYLHPRATAGNTGTWARSIRAGCSIEC